MFSNLTGIEVFYFLVSLLVGMIFHEFMHGFVAYKLGDNTALEMGRLTLNPLKHIDVTTTILLPLVMILLGLPPILAAKPVPFNPYKVKFGEIGSSLVSLAGPLTNLILAILASAVLNFIQPRSLSIDTFILLFVEVNIGLFVFNLIPFPPLDGSRVLYGFAPEPLRKIMDKIESFGFMFTILIILFLFQFFAPVIENIDLALFNLIIKL